MTIKLESILDVCKFLIFPKNFCILSDSSILIIYVQFSAAIYMYSGHQVAESVRFSVA